MWRVSDAGACTRIDRAWPNSDAYCGGWLEQMPHDEGRYVWADGSSYEGHWQRGLRHGVGQYHWASGAAYQGEWRDGLMHGVGKLQAPEVAQHAQHAAAENAALSKAYHRQTSGTSSRVDSISMPSVTFPSSFTLPGQIHALSRQVHSHTAARYQGGWSRGLKHGLGKQHFQNGDVYEGLWKAGVPHGPGRCMFADGSEYDGAWMDGQMNGSGTMAWSSGHRYDGTWKDGQPHGMGVLLLPDGSKYDSQWQRGVRHGICLYYPPTTASNATTLVPRSRQGYTTTKGILQQAASSTTTAKQTGFTQQQLSTAITSKLSPAPGESAASGVTASSRAGRIESAPLESPTIPGWPVANDKVFEDSAIVSASDELCTESQQSITASCQKQHIPAKRHTSFTSKLTSFITGGAGGALRPSLNEAMPVSSRTNSVSGSLPSFLFSSTSSNIVPSADATPAAALRRYDNGRVVKEWPLQAEQVAPLVALLSSNRTVADNVKKQSGKRVPVSASSPGKRLLGETLTQGHQCYEVMQQLQLGIRYSVTRITHEAMPHNLSDSHFQLKVKQLFPRQGCEVTPVHCGDDFTWHDYAPLVFRRLREAFDVDAAVYMSSLCSDAALRIMDSPGKSGSVFYLSHDDQFTVKTLKKGEVRLMHKLLPLYYRHMMMHPHSLLTKFYGLHCVKSATGRQTYFVVMANLFSTAVQLHRKYDLKGSKLGRTAGPAATASPSAIATAGATANAGSGCSSGSCSGAHTILKDLDLDVTFKLSEPWLERLSFQLKADCALLQACHIMDYSLLLGVHYLSRVGEQLLQSKAASEAVTASSAVTRTCNFGEAATPKDTDAYMQHFHDTISKSNIGDEAREGMLEFAKARLESGPGAKAAARRSLQLHDASAASLNNGPHIAGNAITNTNTARASCDLTDHLALQLGRSHTQLGVHMPVRAVPASTLQGPSKDASGAEVAPSEQQHQPQDAILYFGIIDFLQDYDSRKRLEHGLKSIVHDSYSISVTHPQTYAQRFQSYLSSVFT